MSDTTIVVYAQQFYAYLPRIITAALLVLIFWILSIVIRRVFRHLQDDAGGQREGLFNLLSRASRIGLWLIGIVMALGTLGLDVSVLVAGLGLTGFALGFALKDALSNLLAGALILLYEPFQVGDWIAVAGVKGVVTQIDLRYTRIKGEGKLFLVPNSQLFTNTIELSETHPPNRPGFMS